MIKVVLFCYEWNVIAYALAWVHLDVTHCGDITMPRDARMKGKVHADEDVTR